MNLYCVRHGQTEWNVLKKMQGSADIELNDKGIEQAYETRNNLENVEFDIIICSPLKRAKETADIINEKRQVPLLVDDRLRERNYGEFEGVSKSSFDYNEFWSYHINKKYEKAENVQDFFRRINRLLIDIKEKYSDKNILLVSHAGILKAIECYINGMLKDEEIGPFLPENCSVLKYTL